MTDEERTLLFALSDYIRTEIAERDPGGDAAKNLLRAHQRALQSLNHPPPIPEREELDYE